MERAKKMVLIPAEGLKRFQRQMSDVASTSAGSDTVPGDPVSRLDREMSDILNEGTNDSAEKWKLYQQALQRYLYFSNDARKPLQLEIREGGNGTAAKPVESTEKAANVTETKDTGAASEGEITSQMGNVLASVPTRFINKAGLLLRSLSGAPSRLVWDKSGVISIDGVPVPGTNIVDLVNHTARSRKNFNPTGRLQFARFLHAINVPHECVGNEAFWKDIRAFDNDKLADAASTSAALSASVAEHSESRSGRGKWSRAETSRSGIEDSDLSTLGTLGTPLTGKRRGLRSTPYAKDSEKRRNWKRLRLLK